MGVAFDTLAYAKELKAAGFTEQQAEVQAHALARIVDEKLATKLDIEALRHDIEALGQVTKRDIETLRLELRQTEERLRAEMERQSYKLLLSMGSMLVVAVGVVSTPMKIL